MRQWGKPASVSVFLLREKEFPLLDGRAGPPQAWAVGVCGLGGGTQCGEPLPVGSLLTSKKRLAFSPEAEKGQEAQCDCTGFPVGMMPRVGGRPQVRGSGFPEDGSQASQSPPRAFEAGGKRPRLPAPAQVG